jgi:hypothetical protein
LDFIFNTHIRKIQTVEKSSFFVQHKFCVNLVNWLENGETLDQESSVWPRLTEQALATILSKSSTERQTLALWRVILVLVQEHGKDLSKIIAKTSILLPSSAQMVKLIELASNERSTIEIDIHLPNPFYESILQSIFEVKRFYTASK